MSDADAVRNGPPFIWDEKPDPDPPHPVKVVGTEEFNDAWDTVCNVCGAPVNGALKGPPMNRWKLAWLVWLALFPVIELLALARMTIWKDREARTLTQIVEPAIRASWWTRGLFWLGWAAVAVHLATAWW